MIIQIFSVYDSKAEAYLTPLYFKTKGEAVRAMETTLRDPHHTFTMHPEDYTLFHLGDFDDNTGLVAPFTTPKPIGKAIEFKREEI